MDYCRLMYLSDYCRLILVTVIAEIFDEKFIWKFMLIDKFYSVTSQVIVSDKSMDYCRCTVAPRYYCSWTVVITQLSIFNKNLCFRENML